MRDGHHFWYDELLGDRRMLPRILVTCPIKLRIANERPATGESRDLSPDGLRFCCDRETAARIHPGGRVIKPDNQPIKEIAIRLPFRDGTRDLKAQVTLPYFMLTDDNRVAFGMRFRAFPKGHKAILNRFIALSLEPLEV